MQDYQQQADDWIEKARKRVPSPSAPKTVIVGTGKKDERQRIPFVRLKMYGDGDGRQFALVDAEYIRKDQIRDKVKEIPNTIPAPVGESYLDQNRLRPQPEMFADNESSECWPAGRNVERTPKFCQVAETVREKLMSSSFSLQASSDEFLNELRKLLPIVFQLRGEPGIDTVLAQAFMTAVWLGFFKDNRT